MFGKAFKLLGTKSPRATQRIFFQPYGFLMCMKHCLSDSTCLFVMQLVVWWYVWPQTSGLAVSQNLYRLQHHTEALSHQMERKIFPDIGSLPKTVLSLDHTSCEALHELKREMGYWHILHRLPVGFIVTDDSSSLEEAWLHVALCIYILFCLLFEFDFVYSHWRR